MNKPTDEQNVLITSLHNKAMELWDETSRVKDGSEKAVSLLRSAFECEKQAAQMLRDFPDCEPTRSVLYLSAASFAVDCGLYSEALGLVSEGLEGTHVPPRNRKDLEEYKEAVQDRMLSAKKL